MKNDSRNRGLTHDDYIWTEQKCPICDLEPARFLGKRGGVSHRQGLGVETEIWACGACGLVFPNPMPFPVGGLAQHYEVGADDYFAAHDKGQKLENATTLVKEAENLLGRKGKLLDIGVGRGDILVAANNQGWDTEGVEPSETFADYAEQRTGSKIWREPIEESKINDHEFDVVILAAVLEHLYKPDEIIHKISRILKNGGLLYLDVPNESGLFFKVGNAYQKLRGRDWCVNLAPTFSPFHIFGFGPRSLRKLLKKHGLEPRVWKVYGGTSLVPSKGGFFEEIEKQSSRFITKLSNLGEMGTYIETWAVKS